MILSVFAMLATLAAPKVADQFALIIVPAKSISMPVVVHVDFAQVAKALGMNHSGLQVLAKDVRAALENSTGELQPVVCQYDSIGPTSGEIVLDVPLSDKPQRVRVYFTSEGPRWEPPVAQATVKIHREGNAVIVDNGFVRVRHDPARQGGLPSRWEFVGTGKVFENFNNNDRVHSREIGGYLLRNCPDARVQVIAEGPLRAVVQVKASYVGSDGKRSDSQPSAVYEYSYFAGSPYILARSQIVQNQDFSWDELHFVEINFPGTDFTHWARTNETGEFKADRKSIVGQGWGALMDGPQGPNVLGIITDMALIYDGRGEYGTYLHGPWVSWSSRSREFAATLYAAGGPEAYRRLIANGGVAPRPPVARVSTAELEANLQALSRTGAGREAVKWAWGASLIRTLACEDLVHGAELARDAAKAKQQKMGAWEWLASVREFMCAEQDDLAMVWRRHRDKRVSLLSLFDMRARRELLGRKTPPLWLIKAEDRNGKQIAADADVPVSGAQMVEGEMRLEWKPLRYLEGVLEKDRDRLTVRVRARISEGEGLQMEMQVENESSLTLAEVTWPQFCFGPLGDQGEDDVFLAALASGKLWSNPYYRGVLIQSMYPNGWADMQMMGLYDDRGGLVMMAQDPFASVKHIEGVGEGEGMRLDFRWPVPDHTVAGNDFKPPGRVAVVPIRGDWYDAAMVYRAWAEKEAKWWPLGETPGRPDTPQWMQDLPLWALTGGTSEQVVPAVKAFREFMGVPCAVHWYNWHQIPFDDNYPHYFPTKPGFAEGVRELQEAGVRVMPYINGRLWDSDTEDFPTKALPWATKNRKGDYYIEEYGSKQKLVPMCPVSKLWQGTVQDLVKRLVGPECNVDGVYIDQVAAAGACLCYDKSHGHPLGGGHWWTTDGYWPMLEKLQADLAAQYPDKMLTTECTAEPYIHVFDGYLSWHWQEQDAVPLFPAVYGDKVRLFSRAYNFSGDKALVFRMKMAQQFVFGEQLGWLDPNVWKEEKIGSYLRRLAKIRWHLREYFRGRMLRPPTVLGDVEEVSGDWAWGGSRIVTMKAVQAGAFMNNAGEVAVVVTNLSEKPQKFELRIPLVEYGLADNTSFVRWGENGIEDRGLETIEDQRLEMELGPMEAYGLVLAMG